ncbi:gliding motility-associated C-terminal domain-containing protein [Flavobacteriales bacterium]|nr:gliding motility-associated C-terminal domain-containing protein [Flavobacteriales bacterium]
MTITDANTCVTTVGLTITEPAAVVASIAIQADADCNGAATGSATIAGAGGTAPYQFDIGGAQQATGDFTGLTAATYTATVEDANGCEGTIPVIIGEPLVLAGNLDATTQVSCNGVTDGTATVSATGGTTPYTFNIGSGDQATGDFTGLADGDYTVTITDANDCVTTVDLTITEPAAVTIAFVSSTDATCGLPNGDLEVSAGGGTAPLVFDIGGATQASGVFATITPGSYTATVEDANGCTAELVISIADLSGLDANITDQVNVDCFGNSTGEVTVVASGSTAPYSYDIGGAQQATGEFTGLAVGGYTVTVEDANTCTFTVSVTITEPAELTGAIALQTDVACSGDATGAVTVTGAGGTTAYQFDIGGAQQATGEFTGLTAGGYTVTIEDANGCPETVDVTINEPTPLVGSLGATTGVLCNGGSDGTATVTASGATAPYTFNIGTGDQATGDFTGLAAADYTVTITDANDCVTTVDLTIGEPVVLSSNEVSVTDATCGLPNGAFEVTGVDGTTAYQYSDDNGVNFQATGVFSTLTAGDYDILIEDANGCQTPITVSVADLSGLTASITDQVAVDCFGNSTGEVTVVASGSTAPYSYDIGGAQQATGEFTGLAVGGYTVNVEDANACTFTVDVTITEPAELTGAIALQTDVACSGDATGAVTVTGAGGTTAYQFDIGGAQQATGEFTGLTAGGYTVTIEDANGCPETVDVTINEPTPLVGSLGATTGVLCNGGSDGTATVTASGATAPYTFNIGTGDQATGDFTGLAAADYTVTITDANDCVTTVDLTIGEPVVLSSNEVSVTDATCGLPNGAFEVTGVDGTTAYQYSDDNGVIFQPTGVFSTLTAGDYDILIEDANGCQTPITVNVADLSGLTASITAQTDIDCNGNSTGVVIVEASGSTTPYTYSFDGGPFVSSGTFTGLFEGSYTITAQDANLCPFQVPVIITEPAALVLEPSVVQNTLCFGSAEGSVTVGVTGGTPSVIGTYNYIWYDALTSLPIAPDPSTQTATGLSAGSYYVTVTDDNLCGATSATIEVTQPDAIDISFVPTDILCNGSSTGSIEITTIGGTVDPLSDYVYSWTGPNGFTSTDGDLTSLEAGTYELSVLDDNSCTGSLSVTLTENPLIVIDETVTDANCGQANGQVCIAISGGNNSSYTQLWSNGSTVLCTGLVSSAGGPYTVDVIDASNCPASLTVTVGDLTSGTASMTVDNDNSCIGTCDGEATVTLTGVSLPATFVWNGGDVPTGNNNTGSFSNTGLCAGLVSIVITDNDGCIINTDATIVDPVALVINSSFLPATCFGGTDGSVSTAVTGGTSAVGNYSYNWIDQSDLSNVGTTSTVTALSVGEYCVMATDDLNCPTAQSCVTITEPDEIDFSTDFTNSTCGDPDGTVQVDISTIIGGSGVYNIYNWVNQDAPTISVGATPAVSSLPAGTYEVTVTDDAGCSGVGIATISDLTGPSITKGTNVPVSCFDYCDGELDVSIAGGAPPYTIVWTSTDPVFVNPGTEDISGLCAGNYSITVTDANGCVASYTEDIEEPLPVATTIMTAAAASGSGICDGTAEVIATGGNPGAITYDWYVNCPAAGVSSLSGSSVSGLCAGEYAVVSTDVLGCADTLCITIIEPGVINTTLVGTDLSCNGLCDGSATATSSGGVGGYTYQWMNASTNAPLNPSQTLITATNLCAGDYYVIVTDANLVSYDSGPITINEPTPLTGTIAVISDYNGFDISCTAECDGSAEITPTGGTEPYTYAWDANADNQTLNIASNLCAGSYDVVVTDLNGCFQTFEITLSAPPVLSNSFASVDLNCNAVCDGTITSTPAGGTGVYTYLWNDPALSTTNEVIELCADSYDVVITDQNGCNITETQEITEPVALELAGSMTGSNCNQADGTATVTVLAGVASYSYQWIGKDINGLDSIMVDQTSVTAENLFAGCYNVAVTDGNGCSDTLNICVQDLGAPTATIFTQTNVSCNGTVGCDGFAQIDVQGGTPPLNYNWYDVNNDPIGQTTASALNLCAGTYTGEMIDGVGCQATVNVTITEPSALNAVISATTDVTCFGDQDGSATVLASGGTGSYTYEWTDPANQTTATTTSTLFPGNLFVTVTDGLGCELTIDATIFEPELIVLSTSSVSAFCETPTGTATVAITSGGIGSLTYTWYDSNEVPIGQTTATAINLIPGSYNVTVEDANGCTQGADVIVGNILPSDVIIAATTDPLCFGDANGTATASVSGTGTAPYSYEWFNLLNVSQGQDNITATGLAAGDYYVTVTDANGCVSSSNPITVGQPQLITAEAFVENNASCSGYCDGDAYTNVSGGTLPYTYQWDNALAQTTIIATNLCAQTYNVTITDANGCEVTAPVEISEPTSLILDSTVVNANCGLPDGSACVLAIGGTGPYTYLWPDGFTNSCAPALFAGTYCVEVTDVNGCSTTICVEIQDLNGPSAMILDTSMVSCSGFNDGSATVDMIGGNGAFTALWDANAGSQITPTASNLAAGFYGVTITDAVGCNASVSIEITEPNVLFSIQTSFNTNCFASCDGEASIATIGGTTPYSYNWLDENNITIGTADAIDGLCAGDYVLSIVDDQGCTDIINYTIQEPNQVTGSASPTDISCFGECDGTATAMGIVGMTPFSYQWGAAAGNQTGATASGLCPGNYSCTITDSDGCQTTVSATISQPTLLTATINLTGNVSCNGYSDGWAEVSPLGGTSPYTYQWNNSGGSLITATNLSAGTYIVTVTDANGCVTTATTTITQPTPLGATPTFMDVDCFGNCNGSASVIVSGGSGGNAYQWNNPTFATTAAVNNLCAGTYTCLVTDVNGCEISKTVNITQPTQIGMSVSITDANCGLFNGSAGVNVFGGTTPYVYQWNDALTQTTAFAFNLNANCYTLTVTDGNGCFEDSVICLDDIEGPTVTFVTSSDVTCFGDQDGSMQYAVTGGTGIPTLEWVDGVGNTIPAGTNLNTLFGLDGGCYALIATDVAGCVSSESSCIAEPTQINSAIFNFNDVTCNTGCDGDATVNVSGGLIASGYGYSWNDGQTTQQATGLCAGDYTVTVNDDNNCVTSSSVTIGEPTPIVITADNVVNVSCFGECDGEIQISASGGTAPYLYYWFSNGLTTPGVAGLCAGTYTVRITDANGCAEEMDIMIMEPAQLVQSVSTVNATCSDCNGEGSITASGGTAPYAYNWFGLGNSPGNSNNTGLCPGLVTFEVTDANGCLISSTTNVIDEAAPVIDSILFVEPLCNGYSTGNASVYASAGTAPYTYLWDDPSAQTAQTAVALEDGLYGVQVTDGNGCIAFDLVNITEPSPLNAIADIERTICYGEATQIWASGQGGTPFLDGTYTVTWDNLPNIGSAPVTVSPLTTTSYCASVSDANGCLPVSSCVTITVTPALALAITPPIDICFGGAVDLVATATGGDTLINPYTFIWYDDAGNDIPSTQSGNISTVSVSPSTPTTYYAVLTDGCSINDTVSTTVSINPNPQAFIAAFDSSGCAPFTAQFVANSDIGVNFEFDVDCDGTPEYSGPNNTFNYTYTNPGTYDVCLIVASADECFTTINSTAMITVHDLPVATFGVSPEETSILNPVIEMIDYSIGGSIYAWDFGDGTSITGNGDSVLVDLINTGIMSDPTHLYSDTGYYDITLTIFSINGADTCESIYTQTIHIEGDYIFFAPSAFTPNGDGKNDIFIPKGIGIDVITYDFYVFNRWGQEIFESHNKDIGWDGKHKGTPVQIDAYVWLVRTQDNKGKSHEYIGHVTVVR